MVREACAYLSPEEQEPAERKGACKKGDQERKRWE